jgi:hypothetical protein
MVGKHLDSIFNRSNSDVTAQPQPKAARSVQRKLVASL